MGVGLSFAEDGRLSTHLELAHHPFRKDETYEEQVDHAKAMNFNLPKDISLVSNDLGLRGGIWLWRERGPGSTDIFRRL